jgi:hypothetical protein
MSLWSETFVEDCLRPKKPRRCVGHTHTTSKPGTKACFYTKVCRNIFLQFYPAGSTVTLSLPYWTCISIDSATYAERDIPLLKQVPPLQQLARILTKLPPMPVTENWPSHLFTQIPVRPVVQRPLHITPHTNAELHVTIGDCLHWNWYSGNLSRRPMSTIVNKNCRKIMKKWAANSIAPIPSLQHHMNHHTNNTFSTDTYTVDEMLPVATGWSQQQRPRRYRFPILDQLSYVHTGAERASLRYTHRWRFHVGLLKS